MTNPTNARVTLARNVRTGLNIAISLVLLSVFLWFIQWAIQWLPPLSGVLSVAVLSVLSLAVTYILSTLLRSGGTVVTRKWRVYGGIAVYLVCFGSAVTAARSFVPESSRLRVDLVDFPSDVAGTIDTDVNCPSASFAAGSSSTELSLPGGCAHDALYVTVRAKPYESFKAGPFDRQAYSKGSIRVTWAAKLGRRVVGTILSDADEDPIQGALVSLNECTEVEGIVTNQRGTFRFDAVPSHCSNVHSIRVTYNGVSSNRDVSAEIANAVRIPATVVENVSSAGEIVALLSVRPAPREQGFYALRRSVVQADGAVDASGVVLWNAVDQRAVSIASDRSRASTTMYSLRGASVSLAKLTAADVRQVLEPLVTQATSAAEVAALGDWLNGTGPDGALAAKLVNERCNRETASLTQQILKARQIVEDENYCRERFALFDSWKTCATFMREQDERKLRTSRRMYCGGTQGWNR